MLLPVDYVLRSLSWETASQYDAEGEGSAGAAVGMALNLLSTREQGGVARVRVQAQRLTEALQKVSALLAGAVLQAELQQLEQSLRALDNLQDLRESERQWRQTVKALESFVSALNAQTGIAGDVRARVACVLAAWESDDLQSQFSSGSNAGNAPAGVLTAERWLDYLKRRFDDPELQLQNFRPLPGGYGKQTFLFDVSGRDLNGGFVIRRDMAESLLDNDCHLIATEYHLIKAMHARGFPAPDAVWLDTEHRDLPGGDFIVMRRSPGVSGGSFFGAQQPIPPDLTETLASILARLHALPAMPELANLTDSINQTWWSASRDQCVRWYLETWLAMYEREAHLPSPGIVSLFGWLFDHIPKSDGAPVLLHGDIGFHNFLFDQRRLTAVLDWEFSHLGDPAEDLAYVRNSLGETLNWDAFMAAYRAEGGADIDPQRLHFFQVWGQLRNAIAGNMAAAKFAEGRVNDLKLVLLPHTHIPNFLRAAYSLIEKG